MPEPSVAAPERRIRVVLNRTSGSKIGLPTNRATEQDVRDAMRRHGLGDDLVATGSEEEAIAVVHDAVAQRYAAVVAAGGDGTVDTVAQQLIDRPTALGIFPLGSVMNVARMLGIPRDLGAAAAIVATGHVRTIDVGEAKGHVFLEGGSVGLIAAVFKEAQEGADAGNLRSFGAAAWTLLRHQPHRMRIEMDQTTVTTRALAVAIANGPYTGLGFTVAPDAELDDGRFDVSIFRHYSRWHFVRHFRSIAFGRERPAPEVVTVRSATVRIETRTPQPCRADSVDLGTTPITFAIRPAALRVLAPPVAVD